MIDKLTNLGITTHRSARKIVLGSTWLTGKEKEERGLGISRTGIFTDWCMTTTLLTPPHLSSAQTGSMNGGKGGKEWEGIQAWKM